MKNFNIYPSRENPLIKSFVLNHPVSKIINSQPILTSSIVLPTSPPPERFEANPRHHIILSTDFSIYISKS